MFEWVKSSPIAYPTLEVVHIIGIALLLGNLVLFELRAFGAARSIAIEALAGLALPLALGGFALAASSGLLMFASQPSELLANRAFTLKLMLLLAAGINATLFHARGGPGRLDALAKLQTVLSVGLWISVIICGRWIAYR
jgi:hypothetical protein